MQFIDTAFMGPGRGPSMDFYITVALGVSFSLFLFKWRFFKVISYAWGALYSILIFAVSFELHFAIYYLYIVPVLILSWLIKYAYSTGFSYSAIIIGFAVWLTLSRYLAGFSEGISFLALYTCVICIALFFEESDGKRQSQ